MKKKGNKIISLLSLLVMVIGTIFGAINYKVDAEDTYGKLTLSKTAVATSDRTAKVTLEIQTSELKQKTTDVIILMDRSGSMYDKVCLEYNKWGYCAESGDRRLTTAKKQAVSLVEELLTADNAGNVKVGFVSFGTNYESQYSTNTYNDMTSNREEAIALINNLPITDNNATNVHAGLKQAQNLLNSSTADNKIIILISDGIPTRYVGKDGTACGTGNSDSTYKNPSENCDVVTLPGKYNKPSNAAEQVALELKAAPYNAEIYAIGFADSVEELSTFLTNQIASTSTEEKTYAYTATDTTALEEAMENIASSIKQTLATDAIVEDKIPTGFELTAEAITALNEKYGDDITITTNPTTGISTIEVHFAELSSVQGTYVIEYEVKAKDDYNGAMFTNESATLTATATEDNTYYDKNTTDGEGNPVIDKSIELTFDKPVVAIALATKDDDLTSNKIDEGEKVIISQETILGNDRVNEKLEEPYYAPESGVLNSNVLDSTINHTIKIKSVSCGIAKVNDDGNIEYTATVGCVGNPTIEYYVESDVYIYDNTLLNNKLYEVTSVGVKYNEDGSVKEYTETSTITLNVVKVPTSYTVQYLDKDTNKEVADSKVVDANVYDSVTEKAIEVEKYNLAEGEEVEKTIASLAKDASSNVIVFYYTKKPAELVTPDFEKTASVEGNKVTSLTDKITYSLNAKSEIKNFEGDATITLVDKLPFAINLEKSNLNCTSDNNCTYEYDETNKTLTFTITIKDINTYNEPNKVYNLDYTHTIEIVYDITTEDLTGKETELVNNLSGTVTVGKESKSNNADPTPVEFDVKGNVIVKYIDKDTKAEIAESTKLDEEKVGTEYKTTAPSEIEDYKLEVTPSNASGKYEEGTIEVIYEYVRKEAKLDSEINKTTETTTIDDRKDTVKYNVIYNASIEDYKGEATIVIVDQLPYEIDEKSSELNGGKYDASSKTITWTYTENVNTYAADVENNKVEITKEITFTVLYKNIDATKETLNNEIQGTIKVETAEDQTSEDETTLTNINIPGTVIIEYVTKEDGSKLADNETIEGKVGTSYDTTEKASAKSFDGYRLTETPSNAKGTITESETTVTYVYEKIPSSYTVKYLEKDTNKVLVADKVVTENVYVNDVITETAKDGSDAEILKEYDLVSSKTKTITIAASGNEIIFYYTHKTTDIKEPTVEKEGPTNKIESLKKPINYTIKYNTTVENYRGTVTVTIIDTLPHKIIASESNFACEDTDSYKCTATYDNDKKITYTLTYENVDTYKSGKALVIDFEKTISVKYDESDFSGNEETIINSLTTKVEADTNTKEKSENEPTPIDVQGKVETKYVYEKEDGTYVSINNGTLDTEFTAKVGTAYTTEKKTIPGYTYKEVKGATSGKVTEDTITVTYVYTKDPAEVVEQPSVNKNTEVTEITASNQEVSYTIDYKTVITNFEGTVTVTVKDTLEYSAESVKAADGWKVNFDGDKNITFTKTKDVNTYITDKNEVTIQESLTYTVKYKKFAAESDTDGKLTNKAFGSITMDGKTSTGEKDQVDIPLNVKGNVKVNYVEQGTNKELKSTENLYNEDVKVGTEYKTTAAEIPGYKLVSDSGNTTGIVTENLKEVTYYYERKSATPENPVLTKTGTSSVTNINDKVEYKITYDAILSGYEGDVTIEIVDSLPFAIDETKSDIAGGTYDADSKTITWTVYEATGVVPSDSYTIDFEKNIKLVYIGIPASGDKFTNEVQVVITDGTEREEETPVKHETTIDVKGNVTVRHLDAATGKTIEGISNETLTGKVGTSYETKPATIPGYTVVDSTPSNYTGNYIDGTINVTYEYRKINIKLTDESSKKESSTETVTSFTQNVDYQINYETKVEYRGTIEIYVVDQLEYAIDESASELDGGKYDAASKTITWVEKVENLNTYLTGEPYQVSIQKSISLKYVGIPSNGVVLNKVSGYIKTDEGETNSNTPAEEKVTTSVKGDLIVEYIYISENGVTKTLDSYEKLGEYVGTEYKTEAKHFDGYSVITELLPENANGVIAEGSTKVTYVYERVPAIVDNSVVTKESKNEKVESINNAFDYSIKYNTTIDEYEGVATITVVDKLNHAIDTELSELNGGIYDEETLTITWTYNIDVNTYKNENNTINLEIDFTLYYKDLDAKNRTVTNDVTTKLELETLDEPIENEDSTETKLEVPGTVKVNFVDEFGNTISESETLTGLVGELYETTSKEIEGYVLSNVEGNETGEYIDGEIVVTYIYEKEGTGDVKPPLTGTNINMSLISMFILSILSLVVSLKKLIEM